MEFEVTYTPEDLQDALEIKWLRGSRKGSGFSLIISAVLVAFGVWRAIRGITLRELKDFFLPVLDQGWSLRTIFGTFWLPCLIFGVLTLHFWTIKRKKPRLGIALWNADPTIQVPQKIMIDQNGVRETSCHGDIFTPWTATRFWKETPNSLVVRHLNRGLLIIPKRNATAEQLDQLRKLFAENVLPPAWGFPVTVAQDVQRNSER